MGTITAPQTDYKPEHGDHERFAHYVLKDKILESAFSGDVVIALCGKVWVPNRDPSRFPVCPECEELFKMDPKDRAEEINRRFGGGGEG